MPNGDDLNSSAEPLPVGTLTFVMTDIEGSTQLWDDDPAAMTAALHQHDALISAAVATHGGRLVRSKGEGDSSFSVFEDPTAAVSAAEAMRDTFNAASWPTASPVRIRIGVLTGVAELRDGDYYGASINRAARVRSLAHGGEILLAASTYTLIADSLLRNRTIEDRGEHELRGLQRPERVYALGDATAVPVTAPPPAPSARRTRALATIGVCALLIVGAGAVVLLHHSGHSSSAAAANAVTTTTRARNLANIALTNKPSVEIASIELVTSPHLVRYEVAGVSSHLRIPPYEIRVLARSPSSGNTWLWSPPATIAGDGKWTGALDVPTAAGGVPSGLKVSAIAILEGPVSGVTVVTPTLPGQTAPSTTTLPPGPLELQYDHELTTRGPAAHGVIAVSGSRTASS
jgi:class 3 adenylate cyclase